MANNLRGLVANLHHRTPLEHGPTLINACPLGSPPTGTAPPTPVKLRTRCQGVCRCSKGGVP